MEKPDKVGLYQVKSEESDGEWEYVAITKHKGWLMVHDRHIGVCDLNGYHNGLTAVEWKFIV